MVSFSSILFIFFSLGYIVYGINPSSKLNSNSILFQIPLSILISWPQFWFPTCLYHLTCGECHKHISYHGKFNCQGKICEASWKSKSQWRLPKMLWRFKKSRTSKKTDEAQQIPLKSHPKGCVIVDCGSNIFLNVTNDCAYWIIAKLKVILYHKYTHTKIYMNNVRSEILTFIPCYTHYFLFLP